MKKSNQLKIGAIFGYINLIVGNVIALFYTPFMLKCLGQSEYGTYSVVNSIVSYLTIFDLGFSNVIVRYGSQYKAERDEKRESILYGGFIVIYFVIGIVVFLIGMFLSHHLSIFEGKFDDSELRTAQVLMILAVINIAVSFPMGVFRAILTVNEEFFLLKVIDLVRTILTPCCIIILLLQGYKSIALMGVNLVLNLVVMIIHLMYCIGRLHIKLCLSLFEKAFVNELLNYSLLVVIGMVIDKIYWSTDQVILAAVHGPESTAVYSIGATFPSYFIAFSLAVSNVLLPRITAIVSEDDSDANKDGKLSDIFIKVGRIQFWILALILIGFIFWGKEFIVKLWAGPEYYDAYYIALIIMIPCIISLTQNTGISILQAKKKLKFRTYSYLVIALFNIAVSIPLAHQLGGIGSAIGTTIGTILGPIICMNIYYWKCVKIDIPKYWINLLKMSGAIVIPVISGVVLKRCINVDSYLKFGVSAGIFTVIYCISVYFLGMNTYERSQINSILIRIRRKK